MSHQFDSQVKALLVRRRGDWAEIAAGSGVSYSWLSKFANGHIPNPGFATLCKLHDYLKPRNPRKAKPTATGVPHSNNLED
jgi:transcriptional regulator with XRE-family HTH domain